MSDIDCPICGRQVAPLKSDCKGHTCSPECARTKALVDAIKGIETMIAARLPEPLELRAIEHFTIEPSERTQ